MGENRKQVKRAKKELEELKLILQRGKKLRQTRPELVSRAEELGKAVRSALQAKDFSALAEAVDELASYLEKNLARYRPNPAWETIKAFAVAVAIALFIRWMFIEPFRIPSGSMIPTLLIGDQLLVNKMSFGPDLPWPHFNPELSADGKETLKKDGALRWETSLAGRPVVWMYKKLWLRRPPRRGEVVVFRFPADPKEDYIKRVIGLPGDIVEIKEGKLFINGKEQKEEMVGPYTGPAGDGSCQKFNLYHESLDRDGGTVVHEVIHCQDTGYGGAYFDYGPVTVPPDTFLAMGDNRDRSYDSRSWGFVPFSHLKGTAILIHLPLDPENHYIPRWERFFKMIH